MTTEEIAQRVSKIREMAGDPECAHGEEDKLYADFIRHVASLDLPVLSTQAKMVLTTEKMTFARWYA